MVGIPGCEYEDRRPRIPGGIARAGIKALPAGALIFVFFALFGCSDGKGQADQVTPPRITEVSAPVRVEAPRRVVPRLIGAAPGLVIADDPRYPPQALRQRHEGTTSVRVRVNAAGDVVDAVVDGSSGYRELDRAAIAMATRLRFEPSDTPGPSLDGFATWSVLFSLDGGTPPPPPPSLPPPVIISRPFQVGTIVLKADGNPTHVAPSFDCAKAATLTERAICASTQLSRMDAQADGLFRAAMGRSSPAMQATLTSERQRWLAERAQRCTGDVRCISGFLTLRLRALDGLPLLGTSAPAGTGVGFRPNVSTSGAHNRKPEPENTPAW